VLELEIEMRKRRVLFSLVSLLGLAFLVLGLVVWLTPEPIVSRNYKLIHKGMDIAEIIALFADQPDHKTARVDHYAETSVPATVPPGTSFKFWFGDEAMLVVFFDQGKVIDKVLSPAKDSGILGRFRRLLRL
jgi:hypothetical protein